MFSNLCFCQRNDGFRDFKNTDSIYSYRPDDKILKEYLSKSEKVYFLQHKKLKDSIINDVEFSQFKLADHQIQNNYWLAYKDYKLYFFSNKAKSEIDSISVNDLKQEKKFYAFNRLNKISIISIMDKSKPELSGYIIEFKRRPRIFKNFKVFRLFVYGDSGPQFWFKGKDFDFFNEESYSR